MLLLYLATSSRIKYSVVEREERESERRVPPARPSFLSVSSNTVPLAVVVATAFMQIGKEAPSARSPYYYTYTVHLPDTTDFSDLFVCAPPPSFSTLSTLLQQFKRGGFHFTCYYPDSRKSLSRKKCQTCGNCGQRRFSETGRSLCVLQKFYLAMESIFALVGWPS